MEHYDKVSIIFTLLIIFQIKHFMSDFPLQNEYMLGKMKKKGWIFPLFSHVLVHGLFTLLILLIFSPTLWWLCLVDIVIHFIIDRIKASPNMLNRFPVENKFFWWSLGIDQMIHHLTHYFIIYMIITN